MYDEPVFAEDGEFVYTREHSCLGKRRFATEEDANRACKSTECYTEANFNLHYYKCQYCGFYHVGRSYEFKTQNISIEIEGKIFKRKSMVRNRDDAYRLKKNLEDRGWEVVMLKPNCHRKRYHIYAYKPESEKEES